MNRLKFGRSLLNWKEVIELLLTQWMFLCGFKTLLCKLEKLKQNQIMTMIRIKILSQSARYDVFLYPFFQDAKRYLDKWIKAHQVLHDTNVTILAQQVWPVVHIHLELVECSLHSQDKSLRTQQNLWYPSQLMDQTWCILENLVRLEGCLTDHVQHLQRFRKELG